MLDARIFYRLWPEGLPGFRVIPYHSVGKKSGILKGYPVPQMTLIQQGVEREYRNVYLAVSEEIAGEEIPMLLPPALLQETNKARRKKEKIKEPRSFFRKKRKDCKGQKNLAPKGILLWKYS